MLLLLLPGLYLAVALVFAYPAMLLDDAPWTAALRSSLLLVRGNWWRTSAILTVAVFAILVFYAVGAIVGLIVVQLLGGGDVGSVFVATTIVGALVGALFTPFMCALSLAQYADLKLRRAGEDLARRIEALPGT
jgi:membrane-anchored glycerophosphoryl diester phosphodiesterase (GDPDase)